VSVNLRLFDLWASFIVYKYLYFRLEMRYWCSSGIGCHINIHLDIHLCLIVKFTDSPLPIHWDPMEIVTDCLKVPLVTGCSEYLTVQANITATAGSALKQLISVR